MEKPVHLLVIEDSRSDFALVERYLARQGLAASCCRADSLDTVRAALESGHWDAVLSDFNVPGLDFAESFGLIRAKGDGNTPVILVSGTIGEERAVDLLKRGVTDFVLKDNLARLVPAIRRALKEVSEKRGRELAERVLREREAQLGRLLETTFDCSWETDAEHRYTWISPHIHTLLGYRPEEVIGRHRFDFMPQDEAQHMQSLFTGLIAEKRPFSMIETIFLHRNGRKVVLQSSGLPITRPDGTFAGYFGASRDITETKHTEESLRTLSRAIEQSPASVIITDPQGDIEYVNPKFHAVTGYGLDEVRGKNPRIFQSGLTPVETYRDMWQTIMAGETWDGDIQNRKKNGELYWERASISPIRSSDGGVIHFLAVKEDITARKKAEADLVAAWRAADEANHAKTVFLSHMSHELRTPLTAVLGYAEMMSLELRGPLPPGYAGDLDAILNGGRHLLSIIDEVLDITRIELGGYRISLGDINLAAIVEECVAMLTPQCETKGIRLGMPHVAQAIRSTDAKAVRQILINLLGNAVKYTPPGGSISVALTRGDHASGEMITVTDTGCGIAADKLSQVFDPFQRADPFIADPNRGVGLGLSISRRIADLLGCMIAVESELGRGTEVSLAFPPTG